MNAHTGGCTDGETDRSTQQPLTSYRLVLAHACPNEGLNMLAFAVTELSNGQFAFHLKLILSTEMFPLPDFYCFFEPLSIYL